jgi:beta-glucosidase
MLAPGEEKEVTFEITPEDLKFYKAKSIADYRHVWEEGDFIIQIGANSAELQSAAVHWSKSPAPEQHKKAAPGRA